jgi:hypothetical protein
MDDLNVMKNLTKIKIFAQIVSFSFTIYVYGNDLKTFRSKLCITVVDRIMFHKNVFFGTGIKEQILEYSLVHHHILTFPEDIVCL